MTQERELWQVVAELMGKVKADQGGQKLLLQYDQTVTFNVLDSQPFYMEIRNGDVRIEPGMSPPQPIIEAHEIKAGKQILQLLFSGQTRFSDAIHERKIFPVAAHTAKRHIDHWLVRLIQVGLGVVPLKEQY